MEQRIDEILPELRFIIISAPVTEVCVTGEDVIINERLNAAGNCHYICITLNTVKEIELYFPVFPVPAATQHPF